MQANDLFYKYRTMPLEKNIILFWYSFICVFISFQTEKYYLRALGDDPRKDIADVRVQFPTLAEDIKFPEFYPKEKFFSSVFRIASPGLQLWTHYDVSFSIPW
jgi:tRNA wybutosine-synthesizing protein 5